MMEQPSRFEALFCPWSKRSFEPDVGASLPASCRNGQFRLYGSTLCVFIESRGDYNLVPPLVLSNIECRIGGA
jgi:hypothetical protein